MSSKIISLEELYDSKIYIPQSEGISFKNPKEYVDPFVQAVSKLTDNFSVTVTDDVVNANEDGSTNVAYARVLVEARLPEQYSLIGRDDKTSLDSKIGLIYALNTNKPIMKTFAGKDVRACTNLTIFNADHLYSQEMTANIASVYKKAQSYGEQVEQELEEFRKSFEKLDTTIFTKGQQLDEVVGRMLRHAFKSPKLGHTVITQGVRELYDKNSTYALNKEGNTTAWNLYNAITSFIGKSEFTDKAQKTILLSNMMFEINNN